MKKDSFTAALALSAVVGMVPLAASRSVSYTGDGGDEGGPFPPQSCEVIDGSSYVDVAFNRCWGIYYGDNPPVGNLAWCTYALSEENAFFDVVDVDRGKATLVFRRTLSGPVQIQFNGETHEDVIWPFYTFNVTFGFLDGFSKGDELTFNFNADDIPGTITDDSKAGIVSTVSIHVGPYAIPWSQAIESGADVYAGKSPVQAHKCQYPGSARR